MQYGGVYDKSITALSAALAQQVESAADAETYLRDRYGAARGHHAWRELTEAFNAGCASAQQAEPVREWQGLTDEQLRKMHHEDQFGLFCDYDEFEQIARAVEQALKEKNHG
jgi:hypothetical protein